MLDATFRTLIKRATTNRAALYARMKYLEWFSQTVDLRRLADEFDSKHGTDTGGIEFFLEDNGDLSQHFQFPLYFIKRVLGAIDVDPKGFAFVDVGCAKGRVLFAASELPFRKIIGVEIRPTLVETARRNRMIFRTDFQRCTDIEIECADAAKYVPATSDDLLVFFANPFGPETLRSVLKNLASVRGQRRIVVIHCAGMFGFDGWDECLPVLDEVGSRTVTRLFGYRPELLGCDVRDRRLFRRKASAAADFFRGKFSRRLRDAIKPGSSISNTLVAYDLNQILRTPTLADEAAAADALHRRYRLYGPRITVPEDRIALNRMIFQSAFLHACELYFTVPMTIYHL